MEDRLDNLLFELIKDEAFGFSTPSSSSPCYRVLNVSQLRSCVSLTDNETITVEPDLHVTIKHHGVQVLRKLGIRLTGIRSLTMAIGSDVSEDTFQLLPSSYHYLHLPSCMFSGCSKISADYSLTVDRSNIEDLSMLDVNQLELLYLTGNTTLQDLRGVPKVITNKLIITECISLKTFEFLPEICPRVEMYNVGKFCEVDKFLNIFTIKGLENIQSLQDGGPAEILEKVTKEHTDANARIYSAAQELIEQGYESYAAV